MNGVWKQGARFGVVGIAATLIHLGGAWSANRWLDLSEYMANSAGFALAFAVSYLGHFYWTFQAQSRHRQSLGRFLAVALTGFALSNLIVWAVVAQAGQPFEAALAVILLIVPGSSWLVSRLWAFRSPSGL
ncbi:MAG: GtrA family protein [Pseudomonadota bacterium]